MMQVYERHQRLRILPIVFTSIFVAAVFLQTELLFGQLMIVIGLLIVIIPFLNGQNRFLNWLTILYATGQILYLYMLRVAALSPLSIHNLILLNRTLTVIYILPVYMVCRVFIKDFEIRIRPPSWKNKHLLSMTLLLAGLFVFISAISEKWHYILAAAFIQALLQEILWRGLFQQAFARILPPALTMIAIAIASGASQSAIGLPIFSCLLIGAFSMIMSAIYNRTGHLLINIGLQTVLYGILFSLTPIFNSL